MDARITDGAARTNGRRPGHVDMITDGERPAADPSADPPTHRVAVIPRPRAADGGGAADGAAHGGADGDSADTTRVPVVAPPPRPATAGRRAPDPGPRSTPGVGRPAQAGRPAPLPAPDRAASRITSVSALRGEGPAPRVENPAFRAGRGRGGPAAPAAAATIRIPVVPPPRPAPARLGPLQEAPPRSAPPRSAPPRSAPPRSAPPQPGPFRPARPRRAHRATRRRASRPATVTAAPRASA
jgi:hypothetical protein